MLHWNDLRYALRILRRSPLFTALTVAVLGGGLGLSIFTFSFLYTAVVKPLPVAGGDRIVRLQRTLGGSVRPLDVVDVAAMRPSITTLTGVGAFSQRSLVIGDERHQRVINATMVESNMFDLTHTRALLGRALGPGDQVVGAEPIIVLSHRVWRVVFASDTAIIGRVVTLNGVRTRVVGVAPERFEFPVASDAWVPMTTDVLATTTPGVQDVSVYGRLADGVGVKRAEAQLSALLERAVKARTIGTPTASPEREAIIVRSFPVAQIGDEAPLVLAVLNLLASLILLLACINVMNLLLARANERAQETAVRLALGASRGRLMMQSMWESIVLCVLGGAVAMAIAAYGLDAINAWAQEKLEGNLAFWWVWRFDRPALFATCVFVTLAIAVLGAVVSSRVASTEFNAVLRDGGARSGSRREGRVARALVVTQVFVVCSLMFFGVMSSIVAYRVANVDFGYDTRNLLAANVGLFDARYDSAAARNGYYQSLLDGVARNPSIDGVLLRARVGSADDASGAFEIGTGRHALSKESPRAFVQAALGPLSVLGVALRAGRTLDARDNESSARVAVVSAAFAAKHWPSASPIGQSMRLASDGANAVPRIIVGVVSDVLMGNPFARNRTREAIYVPLRQSATNDATIFFRHRGDAVAAQAGLYQTLAIVDPRLAPPTVSTFDEILAKSTLMAKAVTKLFALCFGFALLLAVSGTYGLMARSVGQRVREVGIRRALGATDASVVRLLVGQGGRQLGVGVLIALPLMLIVGVGFSLYFPVGAVLSIGAGVLVSMAIVTVVLAAVYVPTRRVLRVSLRDALR